MISEPSTSQIKFPSYFNGSQKIFVNSSNSKKTSTRNLPSDKTTSSTPGSTVRNTADFMPPLLDEADLSLLKSNILRDRLYSSSVNLNSLKHHNRAFARKPTIPNPILKISKTTSAGRLPQINYSERSSLHHDFDRVGSNYNLDNCHYGLNNNANIRGSGNNNTKKVIFKNLVSVFRFDSDADSGCSASSEYEKKLKNNSPLNTSINKTKNTRHLPALSTLQKDIKNKNFYKQQKNYNSNINIPKRGNIFKATNTPNSRDNDYPRHHLYIDDEDEEDNESGLSVSPDLNSQVIFAYSRPFERHQSTFISDSNSEPGVVSISKTGSKYLSSNQTIYFDDETEEHSPSLHHEAFAYSSSSHTNSSSNLTPTIVTSLQPLHNQPLLYPLEHSSTEATATHATKSNPLITTNPSQAPTKKQPDYGYDVSIELPQSEYDLIKQQQEAEAQAQQQKLQEQLAQPLKQLRYPHLPYSLYLQEVKNHQETAADLKKQEEPKRHKPEATFKYNPLLGSNNCLMITVRLGVPLQPTDVLVKTNKNGSKLRIVSSKEGSSLPENFNEQILLPIQINPYKIAAKIDTSGNLLIEAPILKI